MTMVSMNETDDPENEPGASSQAMNDQLRDDVASWKAARSGSRGGQSSDRAVPVAKPPAPKQDVRAKPAKPSPAPVRSADVKKKPFGMSYDGMSQADYISYRISRGAR
jgi:hypothetical protein